MHAFVLRQKNRKIVSMCSWRKTQKENNWYWLPLLMYFSWAKHPLCEKLWRQNPSWPPASRRSSFDGSPFRDVYGLSIIPPSILESPDVCLILERLDGKKWGRWCRKLEGQYRFTFSSWHMLSSICSWNIL